MYTCVSQQGILKLCINHSKTKTPISQNNFSSLAYILQSLNFQFPPAEEYHKQMEKLHKLLVIWFSFT